MYKTKLRNKRAQSDITESSIKLSLFIKTLSMEGGKTEDDVITVGFFRSVERAVELDSKAQRAGFFLKQNRRRKRRAICIGPWDRQSHKLAKRILDQQCK